MAGRRNLALVSKLFVVATPIGNLSDLSERATRVLHKVPVVVSEVPRSTKFLLDKIDSRAKLVPFFGADKRPNVHAVLVELERGDVALVSEAGTPGVNDPGGELVAAVRAAGHTIVPIAGPNAAVVAGSASGFPMDEFWFRGFVPHKKGRETFFRTAAAHDGAVIFYESPHRIRKTLDVLAAAAPDRYLCVARELTKLHEQIVVATAREVAAMPASALPERGEFVLVLAPKAFTPQHVRHGSKPA